MRTNIMATFVFLLAIAGCFLPHSSVNARTSDKYRGLGTRQFLKEIVGSYDVYSMMDDDGRPKKKRLGRLNIEVDSDMTSNLGFTSDFDYKNYFTKFRPGLPCYLYGESMAGLPIEITTCTVAGGRNNDSSDYVLGFGFEENGTLSVLTNQRNVRFILERISY